MLEARLPSTMPVYLLTESSSSSMFLVESLERFTLTRIGSPTFQVRYRSHIEAQLLVHDIWRIFHVDCNLRSQPSCCSALRINAIKKRCSKVNPFFYLSATKSHWLLKKTKKENLYWFSDWFTGLSSCASQWSFWWMLGSIISDWWFTPSIRIAIPFQLE